MTTPAHHIAAARAAGRAAPVRQHHCPGWLTRAVRRLLRREGTRIPWPLEPLGEIERRFGIRFEHWGTSGDAFVIEPYHGDPAAYRRAAEALGLEFRQCRDSWHFPGRTMRFEFRPRKWGIV